MVRGTDIGDSTMAVQDQDRYLAVCDECGKPQTVRILDGSLRSWGSGGSCPCGGTTFTMLSDAAGTSA